MSDPYIGEIRLFAGNFAPANWAFCAGQTMSIADNETLFNLIGTTYGGDGQTTYNLPDLRGRLALHVGTGNGLSTRVIGESGGTSTVTLTTNNLPIHTHTLLATSAAATTLTPSASVTFAATPTDFLAYTNPQPGDTLAEADFALNSIANAGSGQPHDNMMPYLGLNYIISLFGIFPSQN